MSRCHDGLREGSQGQHIIMSPHVTRSHIYGSLSPTAWSASSLIRRVYDITYMSPIHMYYITYTLSDTHVRHDIHVSLQYICTTLHAIDKYVCIKNNVYTYI